MLANELEDPFGQDANDMPMVEYHEEFCRSLQETICMPWTSHDTWLRPKDAAGGSSAKAAPRSGDSIQPLQQDGDGRVTEAGDADMDGGD